MAKRLREASLAKSSSDAAECLWTQSDQDIFSNPFRNSALTTFHARRTCSCQALFPGESPRTRSLQKACPRAQFERSMFSARELRKSLRFPSVRLLSTSPFHLYFGKVFPNMGAPLFDCSSVASS